MSRAAWAGLLLVGAGMGLVAWFLFRGLPSEVVDDAERARAQLTETQTALSDARKEVDALVEQDTAYLEGQPDVKAARAALDAKAEALAGLEKRYADEVKPLIDGDDYDDADAVARLAAEIGGQTSAVLVGLDAPKQTVAELLSYKTDHQALLEGARAAAATARTQQADTTLAEQVDVAAAAYPDAAPKLKKKLSDLQALQQQTLDSAGRLEALAAAQPVDFVATGKLAQSVGAAGSRLTAQRAALQTDLSQVRVSVDKILIDMKQQGGQSFHKYRVVEGGRSSETDWQPVTAAEYAKHRDHLGMAIYSKPEGALPEDAVTVASPPGYTYVGNPRYGRWETRNGRSFWVFYGQYALMRDLLWGRGYYRPVYRDSWNTYRTSRRAGRPWFGPNKEFGSSGSVTKTRYAGSRYVKSKRAAATQRTKYSGSKYSGSGSKRTGGGYRSSRYRSGSFGGSGK
ncbi:MAG: hypothetical protein H6704_21700 [Myxococcales bacterium]|nr:hypothetical protein [Myxococcales bacterium]MCB9538857.1 hypothetical protein [Myxococcales bacterium]